jgi:hypothetical protein
MQACCGVRGQTEQRRSTCLWLGAERMQRGIADEGPRKVAEGLQGKVSRAWGEGCRVTAGMCRWWTPY